MVRVLKKIRSFGVVVCAGLFLSYGGIGWLNRGTPRGYLPLSVLFSLVCDKIGLQNRHSKWVTGKIVFLKGLWRLKMKTPVLAWVFYLYFNCSGLGITPMQLGSRLLSVGYVVLGLDI